MFLTNSFFQRGDLGERCKLLRCLQRKSG